MVKRSMRAVPGLRISTTIISVPALKSRKG
nr:MAG TPA: hypothetical protein [Caudoviricetes sp.]